MHVIVGAGSVGGAVALELAGSGEHVTLVTRSGGGPAHPLVRRVAADAGDADALARIAQGAAVIYNCANPQYFEWPTAWPPMHNAMLRAAREHGAVLAITAPLYGYGHVDRPMTEDMPLAAKTVKGRVRAQMWLDALASGVRTVEVRSSDWIGPKFSLISAALPAMRRGKTVWVPAPVDVPHSYTYTGDAARTLVALARDPRAWGRAWHTPSPPATTARRLLTRVAELAGLPAPTLRVYPKTVLRAAGLWDRFAKEFVEVRYQHDRPFVVDSSRVTSEFGLTATPLDDAIRETLKHA
ncbi:NAD-dependent epimerase [Dactylosporangium vinaceum]|uniref:NAD-dependent epimerase/dehydratase family protein n=1 Tax=Dactylosporangium vinaceum TaxID=53362 RepID=A0ABV5MI65_9ACTN|nr:NAD-dependent epimerase/dehydratase family protein [Dactylosporangium vinaceum]UAB97515.1 NAD-dependent epimerase [Dactylosporangium vinaceum]